MTPAARINRWLPGAVIMSWATAAVAFAERRFPPPQFDTPHTMPRPTTPPADALWHDALDVSLLAAALGIGAWLVLRRRSRRGVFVLAAACLFYFGFVRDGCVCAIGSVQNVALALSDSSYALPWVIGAFFLLPIVFTVFFGRIFCAGVCPLGAIQDLVSWRPVRLPLWAEHALGLLAYIYLGLAVLFAATGSAFVICEYDPFVAIFRLSGQTSMLLLGGGMLLIGLFVVRPYCRFFCPYGVVLGWLSPAARHRPRIDPTQCINCHLCKDACPVNAIELPSNADDPSADERATGRRRMALMLIALPILIVLGAGVGHLTADRMARMHRTVSLADQVAAEVASPISQQNDATTAFKNSGRSFDQLHAQASVVHSQFAWGTPIFGAFVGLVIGLKLIALSRRSNRSEYNIAQSRCVACARCFEYCPHHPPNLVALKVTAAGTGGPA